MGRITATFRFYAELNDVLPAEQRQRDIATVLWSEASIADALSSFAVAASDVELIVANGVSVGLDHPIQDGDRISIYPVFETFDVTEVLRVRSRPLRRLSFIVDARLGDLAVSLRRLGIDASTSASRQELVRLSREQR